MNDYHELLGEHANNLIQAYGGLTLHVPKRPNDELLKLLSFKAWAFCRHYGGETFYISKGQSKQTEERQDAFCQAVLSAMDSGISKRQAIREQAKVFNISERWGQVLFKRWGQGKPIAETKQLMLDW